MKRLIVAVLLILIGTVSTTVAEDFKKPNFVMIKFVNDTRYKKIDVASELSDLVMEKLLVSGKFNFVETKSIDADMESMLYDNKVREIINAEYLMSRGNYTPLFEGPAFNSAQAESIATAQVGQIITPTITSKIGKQHGAEYLIQGTIINMGNANDILPLSNSMLNDVFIAQKMSGIAIQVDLRIIKAATGEVIWQKSVIGSKIKNITQIYMFKFGDEGLTSETYSQAMEDAAQKISNELINAIKVNELFVR